MEEQDMRQCTSYGEDEFVCTSRQPVYNLNDKGAPCEAQVFNQQATLSCILNDIECKETWTKLHKPNMWLFTLCEKQLMRVICNDQVTPAVIDGTGVISLKPKCLLQKKDATIFTYNQLGSNFNMNADIEVPTINSTINNIVDLSWKTATLNITALETLTETEIRKVDRQLEVQKQNEILPNRSDISNHDIYLYSVTSLLLGGISILAFYISLKRWCKRSYTTKTGPQPKGRDNFGGDIELQEIRNSTPAEPTKIFHFADMN